MTKGCFFNKIVGWLEIIDSEGSLTKLEFLSFKPQEQNENSPLIEEVKSQLEAYFSGEIKSFDMSKIPVNLKGTPFQKRCWNALFEIPYGETHSYQEQAIKVGSPEAVRAVGGANAKNPIAIIYPCHRVIGKNGKLTGFAGGLDIKERLLNFEKNSIK
ncbi:MAG: methylated-DNA--[protein]-cysteine S-methyltransferase [Fusobacteria bacterium]|nr:methylated-DNA--[protein]-cysteine S-methyltransferase [Fusobacteriota bacterium]